MGSWPAEQGGREAFCRQVFFAMGHTWDPPRYNTLAFLYNRFSPSAVPHVAVADSIDSVVDVAQDCKFWSM